MYQDTNKCINPFVLTSGWIGGQMETLKKAIICSEISKQS